MSYIGYKNKKGKIDWLTNKYNKLEQKAKNKKYILSQKQLNGFKRGLIVTIADEELVTFEKTPSVAFPFWDNAWYYCVDNAITANYSNTLYYTISYDVDLGSLSNHFLPYIKMLHYFAPVDDVSTTINLNTVYNELYFYQDDSDDSDNYHAKIFLYTSINSWNYEDGNYDKRSGECKSTVKLYLINPYNFEGSYIYEKSK